MDAFSMKSSRRKQSKPIRVSHNDDPMGQLQPPPPEEEYVNGDNMDTSDSEREKENEMQNSNTSMNSKNSESFPPLDLVKKPVSDMGDPSPLNLARDISMSSYLTPYHRLGSEFLKGTSNFISNGDSSNNVLEGENNVDKNGHDTVDGEITDSRKSDEESNGEKPKDRSGIFHPDAYCDLCDKEFCNKYFLKTHKANKHGIYENNTSPFPPSVNPLPPSLVLPQDAYSNLPLKLNLDYPLPSLKSLPGSAKSPPTMVPRDPPMMPRDPMIQREPMVSREPPPSPLRQTPPATQPLSQTPTKRPGSPLLSSITSKPRVSTDLTSNDSKSTSSSVSQDMEDFCEICQKHFCNKYYLKKHKNDVHGIPPPDAPLSGGKRGGRPPNSETKLPASSSESPLIPHSLANMPGLPNMPGVMVLNPFLPPMLIPAGSLMSQPHQLPPRPPHLPVISSSQPLSSSSYPFSSSLPITSSSDMKSLSPGSTSATSPSPSGPFSVEALRNMGIPIPDGVSPSEALRTLGLISPDGQIPSDSFRGMGILNAEAFCDICRKEFCNKYFLKIHKANKHGIFMDEPILPLSLSSAMPPKPSDLTANTSEKEDPSKEKDQSKDTRDMKPETSPKAATTPVSQPQDSYMTYCNLCSQEFASKYAYRIHRIQAHGMINESFNEAELAEEAFRLHNGELPKHISAKIAEEIAMMERNSEAGFSTMFGSMVAAKLADRVNCDICNKELCNKYFLKAHKLKVHGIDTTVLEKSPKPGTLPSERMFDAKLDFSPSSAASRLDFSNIARTFNLKPEPKDRTSPKPPQSSASSLDLSSSSIEKPSNEALVKLGMDPEAYCEICKKEFCSKYFLRTHKQNIHGIPPKTESSESLRPSMPSFSALSSLPTFSTAPHLALSAPLLPSPLPLLSGHPSPSAGYSQIKPMNLSSSGSSSSGKSRGRGDRTDPSNPNWKWKEPQNSARVTCDLCSKELCNKYFLRTHKLNKHGIPLEDQSPTGSQTMSPSTSDIETSSNSSMPTDLTLKDKHRLSPKLNLENSKLFTNKPDDKFDNPLAFSEALNLKLKTENDRYYQNQYSETCHLCDRRFKSSKWLKQHILKDHAGLTALSPTMEKAFNLGMPGNRFAPLELRTCSVCSIVFPSEMSMQLHMIQEHNAQVTIKTDSHSPTFLNINGDVQGSSSGISKKYALKRHSTFSLKQKMYSCSVCSQKSKWLSKILSHERQVHGIKHDLKKFRCTSCRKVFRNENIYKKHMMTCHGNYTFSDLEPAKKYSCTTCGQRFPSLISCHLHIRRDHIRRRSFHINNQISDRYSCSQCGFATRFRKQLQRHTLRSHRKPQNVSDMDEVYSGKNNNLPLHAEVHDSSRDGDYVMQTFRIQQCNDDGVFVTSVVEMPVLKRLKNTASISFLVTPLEGR